MHRSSQPAERIVSKKNFYKTHTPEKAIGALEKALAELLQAYFAAAEPQRGTSFRVIGGGALAEKMQETRPDLFVDELVERGAVRAALRQAVREIGVHLNAIGGMDLMEQVLERVARQPLACYGHTEPGSDEGKQSDMVDVAWDGIGTWVR